MAKRLFLNSLKLRIALASVLLVSFAVASVVFYMQKEMETLNHLEQYKNAQTLLQSVCYSVENQYKSILFHKETMLQTRKNELQSVVNMAHASLQTLYGLVESGQLSEAEAKTRAIDGLRQFRYKNGVGYLWINDMGRPYPKMIMNPALNGCDGEILDSPEFNCALGRDENLFKAFVDIVELKGEGFVDYFWPRPTQYGWTEKQPKISYVKHFVPWGWVIGSGLYVDDLDRHVKMRIATVLNELNETFGRIKIAESGYLFIFTGARKLLFHPLYKGEDVSELLNPATGNKILDDLAAAAARSDGKIEYLWDMPQHKGEFHFKKIAFVNYFEPLDWYISSSFYLDELGKPARQLQHNALLFSLIFMLFALGLALYVAHKITRPMQQIVKLFSIGAQGDYSTRLKLARSDEFGELANYFNIFMAEIESAHNQLLRSENRFRALFDKSADARLIVENNHFTECNDAVVKMFRTNDKSDVLGYYAEKFSPQMQPDGIRSCAKAALQIQEAYEKGSCRFSWNHVRFDGEEFPAEVELTAIQDGDKKILHVLVRDMTRQKEIEQQLVQSQKMEAVGTMAGGIAHDFNNILSAIFGYTDLAEMHIKDNPKVINDLHSVQRAARRAQELVKQILTFSRQEEHEKRPLKVALVVEEALKLIRSSVPTTIMIQKNIVSQATAVADATQIHQIVMNLCTNAHHAMRERGGVLVVSLTEIEIASGDQIVEVDLASGKYLRLEVSDTGTGMSEQVRKKIFEPYFTSKGVGVGTGLGLAIVHGIVKNHHGQIHVYSEPGHGSTFNVYLPIVEKISAEVTSVVEKETIKGGCERILFVDDEKALTKMAYEIFSSYGYMVDTFNDSELALENFVDQPEIYDLIVTDMTMPVITGAALAQKMMAVKPDLPVILCSGYSEIINREKSLALGIRQYWQKPVVMSKLLKSVRDILDEGKKS